MLMFVLLWNCYIQSSLSTLNRIKVYHCMSGMDLQIAGMKLLKGIKLGTSFPNEKQTYGRSRVWSRLEGNVGI